MIFNQEFLHKMENLTLRLRGNLTGQNSGERRSRFKGMSVEFADYRNYTSGDDFRQIDWKAYARLERLFLKLSLEEKETTVTVLLDCSRSMAWGEPVKSVLAKQLGAALGYLSLAKYDRVAVVAFNEKITQFAPPQGGKHNFWQLLAFLEGLEMGGQTNLNAALRQFSAYRRGPGVAIVISDLLTPQGFAEGLKYLQYLKQEVILVQILSPDELAPQLQGELRLIDVEDGSFRDVTVTPPLLAAYRRALAAYLKQIQAFCSKYKIAFVQMSSALSLEEALLQTMRNAGIVG